MMDPFAGALWVLCCVISMFWSLDMDRMKKGPMPKGYKPSIIGTFTVSILIGSTIWTAILIAWIAFGALSYPFNQ